MAAKKLIKALADFYQGDTRKYRVIVKNKITGEPISVDGGTLFITFKSSKSDTDENAAIAVSFPATEVDPQNPTGEILATLTAANTSVPYASYYYDFQFVSSGGEVTTLLPQYKVHEPKVKILEDITNRVVPI